MFVVLLLIALFLLGGALSAGATAAVDDKLNVSFPGVGGEEGVAEYTETPANYIRTIYRWSIGLAALLAMAQIIFGGVLYILAAGSLFSQEEAKSKIKNALAGLLLLIAITIILNTINPSLTILGK